MVLDMYPSGWILWALSVEKHSICLPAVPHLAWRLCAQKPASERMCPLTLSGSGDQINFMLLM